VEAKEKQSIFKREAYYLLHQNNGIKRESLLINRMGLSFPTISPSDRTSKYRKGLRLRKIKRDRVKKKKTLTKRRIINPIEHRKGRLKRAKSPRVVGPEENPS